MNKVYIIKEEDILTVLNRIQEFKNVFDDYLQSKNKYNYSINIEKEEELWVCKIEINEKSNNTQVFENTPGTSGVL